MTDCYIIYRSILGLTMTCQPKPSIVCIIMSIRIRAVWLFLIGTGTWFEMATARRLGGRELGSPQQELGFKYRYPEAFVVRMSPSLIHLPQNKMRWSFDIESPIVFYFTLRLSSTHHGSKQVCRNSNNVMQKKRVSKSDVLN